MDNQGTPSYQTSGFNTNINRFVPGGYIVGAFANQRSFVRTVTPGDPDRNPIQVAINEANRLGGGVVNIGIGTYVLGSQINLFNNVFVNGQDSQNTVIDCNGGTYGFVLVGSSGNSKNNVVINNLKIINSTRGSVIDFRFVDYSLISNCIFSNNYGSAQDASTAGDINLSDTSFCRVENNTSSGGEFFASTRGTHLLISNNLINTYRIDGTATIHIRINKSYKLFIKLQNLVFVHNL